MASAFAPSIFQSPAKLQRVACVVGGTLLLIPVSRRRTLWRYGAAAVGSALIYNGISGSTNLAENLFSRCSPPSRVIVRQSITIGRSAVDLSLMWRNPDVIARVIEPFGDVEILGTDHLRWKLSALGSTIAVECTLAEERSGELVHWKSTPTSGFRVDERMRFQPAPQDRGTEVTLEYDVDLSRVPAGTTLGSLASHFEGAEHVAIRKVLHNFKSLAETGEIPTLERNPSARANGKSNGDLI